MTRKFSFRAEAPDVAAMTTIMQKLRDTGDIFATRTDALRVALKDTAARMAAPVERQ